MNIGLLECDDVAGRFPHIEGGYREMFAALLPEASFRYYEAHQGNLPQGPRECDAWLCTGSQYSVYEKRDWIGRLLDFMKEIDKSRAAYVGICFGHQLLAQALGGEVARAPQGWGVGVQEVQVVAHEPWMQPPRERLRIQHMHADQVQRLPPGAVVLGRSAHCEIGMFRVGHSMLGIEGHPEFTAAFAEALIRARTQSIGAERAQAALAAMGSTATDGPLMGEWIRRFLERSSRYS